VLLRRIENNLVESSLLKPARMIADVLFFALEQSDLEELQQAGHNSPMTGNHNNSVVTVED
jgi:hypothetical protein